MSTNARLFTWTVLDEPAGIASACNLEMVESLSRVPVHNSYKRQIPTCSSQLSSAQVSMPSGVTNGRRKFEQCGPTTFCCKSYGMFRSGSASQLGPDGTNRSVCGYDDEEVAIEENKPHQAQTSCHTRKLNPTVRGSLPIHLMVPGQVPCHCCVLTPDPIWPAPFLKPSSGLSYMLSNGKKIQIRNDMPRMRLVP